MAKLYFYYAAMNAGKTTRLLQSNFNYKERGMNTIIYTTILDNRFGKEVVASRIGLSEHSNTFDANTNIYEDVKSIVIKKEDNSKECINCICVDEDQSNKGKPNNIHTKNISCVLIDEAQFLSKQQVKQLCQIVDEFNIPVLAYGLRSDFLGEALEGSKYLLLWADELIEIKTMCFCGRKATMNAKFADGKIVRSGNQVDIGGNDKYISLCRKHFNEGRLS